VYLNSELSWLPNSLLKDIILPTVIIEENKGQNYAGFYRKEENLIWLSYDEKLLPGYIAHEFMHHLQHLRGSIHPLSLRLDFKTYNTYDKNINIYFNSQWWELEALLFEYKIAKDYLNEWWLRKLVMEN